MYKLYTPFLVNTIEIWLSLCTLASRRYFNFSVLNCPNSKCWSTFGKSKLSYIIAPKAPFFADRFSITSAVIPSLYTAVWRCWRRAIRDTIICSTAEGCEIVYHFSFASNDQCFILNCLVWFMQIFSKSLVFCFLWFVRFTLYLGL